MSGVMFNIQYMPSPHGVSKRIRLHHNEPFSNHLQEIGQYGFPDKANIPDNVEFLRTTYVWMRNCQFKESRNAFLLVSRGVGSCSKHERSNGIFRDTVVQSLRFSDSDLWNTIKNKSVKPTLDPAGSNLLKACKDTNSLSMLSKPIESKHACTTQKNDMNSFNSSTVLHYHYETQFKDKLPGIVKTSSSVISSLDNSGSLDNSKGSSLRNEQSAESTKGRNDTNILKGNQYEHNTSKLGDFHCDSGYQNNSVKCKTNSSGYIFSLDSNDNYLEKIIKPLGGVGEHKDQKRNNISNESNVIQNRVFSSDNIKEHNINHKLIAIGNSLSHKGKLEAENVNLLNHLNFEIKVLPWKTYSRIVKRLPDYKLFCDVIQKAMQKVKYPKIFFEPILSEESTLSKKTLSTVTENLKVAEVSNENTITKSKQNVLLRDLNECDDFLDFAIGKIQEMVLLISSTSNDIKLLDTDSEDISIVLHRIRSKEYLSKSYWKLCIEVTNIVTSTRKEILTLGDNLLQKIGLLKLDWMVILRTIQINLITVSRLLYILCSSPIESMLTDHQDLVLSSVYQVKDQIKDVEAKEKELAIRRDCNFSKLQDLQEEIGRFYRLDTIMDEHCKKYFD